MNKQVLLNQLRIEKLHKLSNYDKKKVVLILRNKYGLTYRAIEKETGIAIATMHHWIEGRCRNFKEIDITIEQITRALKVFIPTTKMDYEYLKTIKRIAMEKLKNGK